MKKIGFVDLYISEWHANNYPIWINEICKRENLDYKVCYAYAKNDISPVDKRSTDEWCAKLGVEKCDTIQELCEKSDNIMVLAPTNPETHLEFAKAVLPYGKATYIDKTFAPDYSTALKIFEIANKYGTKFFSSSALRFADEIKDIDSSAKALVVCGCGSSIEEYGIHVIEIMVKTMGVGASKVRVEKAQDQICVRISYNDGRNATIIFNEHSGTPFIVMPCNVNGLTETKIIESDYFRTLMREIILFFETGVKPFDSNQTLEIIKIRDAILNGLNNLGDWIYV